ncbi:MAG: hypothetical protein ACD_60C00027G0019 [uncultured bacterium]|nr:MAG: hypothetical protein ACD_60C00027G0019 [uncultured bacterium]
MIMCRQIYFPVIAAFWLAGVVADEKKQALKFAACVTLVSTITMALFVWQWHGLTPGYSQDINKFVGISLSGILHEFSMLGVLAIAYLPIFCADRRYYKNYFLLLWALAALFSFILWASTFSTPDFDAGRGGSVIWRIAGITPSYHQHSWIILFLSFLGMFSLLNMIFHAIFLRYYPIETIMLLCYFLSCASQIFAFQRYVEIPILITYAVFGARVLHASRLSFAGPFLLATSFGFITILRISMKILGKTITT